ncbi:hypothetical protein CCM_00685 [Cordyceps militaris CM01]|uniref:Uncharacterized protein n=1 Tax=Cordyceps militaris (strain CM01) TaxID=983644 RepID=G3J5G9_CORMM|nr:uncharacterized protein CCM_00685 [Cordyceps militaris CM01]EGX96030.1 hypothetical protein CCM_00685 [Cordyceps militaris CM01]
MYLIPHMEAGAMPVHSGPRYMLHAASRVGSSPSGWRQLREELAGNSGQPAKIQHTPLCWLCRPSASLATGQVQRSSVTTSRYDAPCDIRAGLSAEYGSAAPRGKAMQTRASGLPAYAESRRNPVAKCYFQPKPFACCLLYGIILPTQRSSLSADIKPRRPPLSGDEKQENVQAQLLLEAGGGWAYLERPPSP